MTFQAALRARMASKKPPHNPVGDLTEYRQKRDFAKTAEPAGSDGGGTPSGRLFVVQKHAARRLHYDLRLEFDGVLKSWAVPRGPSLDPKQKNLAVHTEDHPIEYGDFEGIIPAGEYGGGTVMLWDRGEWEPLDDAVEGYAKGDLKFRLKGTKLTGDWVLARMTGEQSDGGKNWLLIKKKDASAQPIADYNILAEESRSVVSGRSLDEIAEDPAAVWKDGQVQATGSESAPSTTPTPRHRQTVDVDPATLPGARSGHPPDRLSPQLATVADAAPADDEWIHEIKLDGYRLMTRIDGDDVRLFTRNGHDWTDRFGTVPTALSRLPLKDGVLDGEVVVLDNRGISDFGALQNAFKGYTAKQFVYFLFDIPFANGIDLRGVPLIERKRYLAAVMRAAPLAAPTVRYCDHIVGKGPIVHAQAADAGLEGIISKRAASRYESRRSDSWRKVKCTLREAFVVGGLTEPSGSRPGFGSLLLGQYDEDGQLVYCGRVGTGFTDRVLEMMTRELLAIRSETPPFIDPDRDPDAKKVHWVEPRTVVEVEFTAWTHEELVRHAVYRGTRDDIAPEDVLREDSAVEPAHRPVVVKESSEPVQDASPDVVVTRVVKAPRSPDDAFIGGVRVSNPRRTVYPDDGVTKLAVVEYYDRVAEWILPLIVDRPLSLVRCPLGLAGEQFYQRQLGEGFPEAIRGIEIDGEDDGECIYIRDREGLLSLAQMGVLEIHPWGSKNDRIDRPDQMILDLDPGRGIKWEHIVESARVIREYLLRLDLETYVKTSGGKGMHLVVPLRRRSTWDEIKQFSKAIADDLARMAPLNFVSTMSKTLREQRIYIDYLRNLKGSTSVGAYSTRARTGAMVSTPLDWDELSDVHSPKMFTVVTVPERLESLESDPWEGFLEPTQSITAAHRRALGMDER